MSSAGRLVTLFDSKLERLIGEDVSQLTVYWRKEESESELNEGIILVFLIHVKGILAVPHIQKILGPDPSKYTSLSVESTNYDETKE